MPTPRSSVALFLSSIACVLVAARPATASRSNQSIGKIVRFEMLPGEKPTVTLSEDGSGFTTTQTDGVHAHRLSEQFKGNMFLGANYHATKDGAELVNLGVGAQGEVSGYIGRGKSGELPKGDFVSVRQIDQRGKPYLEVTTRALGARNPKVEIVPGTRWRVQPSGGLPLTVHFPKR